MRIIKSPAAMQTFSRAAQRRGAKIAFVPTMGFLHPGHLSLIHGARSEVGSDGLVVVSIFVNPTQFAPNEDFSRYPRDFRRDTRLCRDAGVDALFAPATRHMYPPGEAGAGQGAGAFSTFVQEQTLSRYMEGLSRPTHFRGVTTVVAKLFNIVLPDLAIFGAKDFQQAAIIRRMTRDLNFPVKIIVAPTLREPDGLAMSSRNKYLTGDLRRQALVLWRSIQEARRAVRNSAKPVDPSYLRARLKKLIETEPDARLDYIEFFDPNTLAPVKKVTRGTQLALAVRLGPTRLIDNARL